MKRRANLTMAFLAAFLPAVAMSDDSQGGAALVQPPAKATPATPSSPVKKAPRVRETKVKASGYFVDAAAEPKKQTLINLRAPVDASKDTNNIVLDPKTQKVKGFKLLSFDF